MSIGYLSNDYDDYDRSREIADKMRYAEYDPEEPYDMVNALVPLLNALERVSEDFWNCIEFSDIYDNYLYPLYESLTGDRGRRPVPCIEGLSDVEYAQMLLDAINEFIPDLQYNIQNCPDYSSEHYLYDIEDECNAGIKEMQQIINNGGLD